MSESFNDAQFNVFGQTLSSSYAEPLSPPGFTELPYRYNHPLYRKVIPWEIVLDEPRGKQVQADRFERSYAGWSTSTADPRFRNYLINPIATTRNSQSFGGSASNGPLVWCDGGTTIGTVLAQGTTANRCLASAIVTVTPAPNYVTYSPGSAISSLMAGTLNSTQSILVGRTGATIDVHTTLGTSLGTMHANLTACWGGAISSVNESSAIAGTPSWLFYANAGIWRLSTNVAIGTAPTQASFNVPNGGAVLGFDTLSKSPYANRMYMLLPKVSSSNSMWHTPGSTPGLCRLASTNDEGTDLQEHVLPTNGLYFGRLWQRKAVVSDGGRVLAFDGTTATDLNIFASLSLASSSAKGIVVGLGGDDSSLIATVLVGTTGAPTIQKWEYNEQTHGWSPLSKQSSAISIQAVADGSPFAIDRHMILYGPNLPYSRQNAYNWTPMYNTSDVTWEYQFSLPRGVNPLLNYALLETGSVHTWPTWVLPGRLGAHPSIVTEIDGRMLDLEAGGAGSTSLIEVATQSSALSSALTFTATPTKVTFATTQGIRSRIYHPPVADPWHRLQLRETLTAGVSRSPNGLPLVIRGATFMDDVIRQPSEVPVVI